MAEVKSLLIDLEAMAMATGGKDYEEAD